MWAFILCCVLSIVTVHGQPELSPYRRVSCPPNWVKWDDLSRGREVFTCYKFVRSPKKNYQDAKELCKTYQADLLTISTNDEHGFMVRHLHENDPLHRKWYVGIVQKTLGFWENEDGTPVLDRVLEEMLPNQAETANKRYMAYSYSYQIKEWGLLMLDGSEPLEFICEIPSNRLTSLILDAEEERDHEFGLVVQDPKKLERGPKIIRQPVDAMFDLLKKDVINHMSVTCLADGYPPPSYEWYREEYKADELTARKVDPLQNSRFTVSGGTLIVNNPIEIEDRGKYFCIATNKYGSVVSKSVQLSFAFMAEFNLKRSTETGNQNWGKAIYCDPPQYFPDARFYWSRSFFPNFVDEDKRTFVSFDGNLYFSYLDNIDQGSYSCTVQSTVSDIGRHGPFFNLEVKPHPNYQQLKFANNFPKAFPDSPVRGDEVRMECIAFGYPVPAYNWTRRNGPLPRGARLENYNRVLILPRVEPSDIGDYTCRAHNQRLTIDGTVSLSIQATPTFTIPLKDHFIAEGSDVMLECEAFAIPDVTYSWLRNAKKLSMQNITQADKSRYVIADNILKIQKVTKDDQATYQCKAENQLAASYSSSELKVLNLAPTFRKRPLEKEIYAAEGTNITIKCRPEAAPAPQFEWRKDNLKIGRGGRHDILRNGDLKIRMVSREDRGIYNCTATNTFGSDSSGARMFVLNRPLLLVHPPEEIFATVGEDLYLQCEAYMDEILDLTYVWSHNDMRIEVDAAHYDGYSLFNQNQMDDFYTRRRLIEKASEDDQVKASLIYTTRRLPPYERGFHAGHLLIRNLTLEDEGHYLCDARTPVANISYVSKVTMFGPPGPPGGIAVLEMTSTAARIQWTNGARNGRAIQMYSIQGKTTYDTYWKSLVEHIEANVIDLQKSRMEYQLPRSLTPYASYRFRVRAINVLGEGEYSAPSPTANTRQDIPFIAPANVSGGGGKTGDLTITWTPLPPVDQNAPDVYYRVFWRRVLAEGSIPEQYKQEIVRNGNDGLFVAPVEPQFFYTEYEVKVQSANRLGWGPVSEPSIIYSAEDMPQVQPTEVKAFAYNATALNITWRPIELTRDNIRGKLIGYRIKYWREIDSETEEQIRLNLGVQPHGLIVGLVPNTFYWVRVMAYNSAGSGPESEKFRERTWRSPPLTPPNAVRVEPIDPTTIYVTWRGVTPTYLEEALLGYKVRIWEADQDMTSANDTIVPLGSDLETYIYGLEVGKMYKLRVLAYSLGGDGKMSAPPWHFSMGDPDVLRAGGSMATLSAVLILCVFIFIPTRWALHL